MGAGGEATASEAQATVDGDVTSTRLVLHPPRVEGQELVVSWTATPPIDLYERDEFRLSFPASVGLAGLPDALGWTVALLCLHAHWSLLRPCRVELPVVLAPGQAETWMRLIDATVATHDRTAATHARTEGRPWGPPPGRGVHLVESGPRLAPLAARASVGGAEGRPARVVSAFSGGKDSLLQLALLDELGLAPIAVAVTSPLADRHDQSTARRAEVLAEVADRLPVELVEVHSDLRPLVDNGFASRLGWHTSVTEMTDTHLYAAAALVVAWARRAGHVFLASEAEVQENVELDATVVQHPHLMYSAVSQQVIDALLRPLGIGHGSLTYPLPSGHVQHLLWSRYPQVRGLQYSCWRVPEGRAACSECSQCLRVAIGALRAGGSPAEMGIDVGTLFAAQVGWRPSAQAPVGLPDDAVRSSLHGQVVRNLALVEPADLAAIVGLRRSHRTVRAYRRLRRGVLAGAAATPDPGYRAGYLDLVDPIVRPGLEALLDGAFDRADPRTYEPALARTHRLIGWITAPLEGPTEP